MILRRVAFETSRLAEFCSQKELVAQTGHGVDDWPRVVLKELLDNALDACEEAEIAPVIDIKVSTETEIIVTDNGPGLPSETVEKLLDFNTRVSSREAYASPTRGAQGNALKTVIAMGFALDGNRGVTIVEAHGTMHRIIFEMDPVRREPRVLREISASVVKNGTRITIRWPDSACSIMEPALPRFLQMLADFTVFNPHLTVRCDWGGRSLTLPATNTGFQKWRACDPTSAHWYTVDGFSRYMAAHIARDQDQGRDGRMVREFIEELRGLTGSAKQKKVLASTGASRMPLADFFDGDKGNISQLLDACKEETKPVAPKDLGIIGADHLREKCLLLGAAEWSFKYKRRVDTTPDGLPYVIEAAFAYCPDREGSSVVTGVNFSVGIRNPFQEIGFRSLSSLLEHQMAGVDEPIVFILHYTCPRIGYTDRGKSTITLPYKVGVAIRELVEALTKEWRAQRKREEKEATREQERRDRLSRASSKSVSFKDAAHEVMESSYLKASDDGKLPTKARQIMYVARPKILAMTGKDTLRDEYFTQTLLVDYMNEHPDQCASWDVIWDARGTFKEPHTGKQVPLGTLEVRQYLGERPVFAKAALNVRFNDNFPTCGPQDRYSAVLFIEKEGFDPIIEAAAIDDRYDVAVMSSKGMSSTAARRLIDKLSKAGVRVFVLHDFDYSGFIIQGTLATSNRRYQFENYVPLVDLGLRLSDVERMSLESEPVVIEGSWSKRAATLERHGATDAEIAFLRNRRVELNAMTSRQIIDFIEAGFAQHGVTKVIPDAETIGRQARNVVENKFMEEALKQVSTEIAERVKAFVSPADLRQRIQELLNENPRLSWDEAVANIIRRNEQ
jgi:DNA topoisomerase VI subunit B